LGILNVPKPVLAGAVPNPPKPVVAVLEPKAGAAAVVVLIIGLPNPIARTK